MTQANPLIRGIQQVNQRVADFKARARDFYFKVMLLKYPCPLCGQSLAMGKGGQCFCPDGHRLDPTVAFQRSPCCQASLKKQILHYRCSRCGAVIPSKFVFDERVFDAVYFRERMRQSRDRARKSREELKKILSQARSRQVLLLEELNLDCLPGLIQDLDDLCGLGETGHQDILLPPESYDLAAYTSHIRSHLAGCSVLFSQIPKKANNRRLDRVWRFMTLLFMDQAREVEVSQHGQDLMVRRVAREAD